MSIIKKRQKLFWLTMAAIAVVIFLYNTIGSFGQKNFNRSFNQNLKRGLVGQVKSGNLSIDYSINQALEDVDRLKLNTVNVPIAINVSNLTSDDMEIDKESKDKAIVLIGKLKAKGIKIILEPYPWINEGSAYETEWNPANKETFFRNWENKALTPLIEEIAEPYKLDAFIVASNLVMVEEEEEKWCSVIDNVKSKFKGLVTYKTSWWYTASWDSESIKNYERKLNNKLFSKVDYISIAAYFELVEKAVNSVRELQKALHNTTIFEREQDVVMEIENFNKKWGKPIFFGELGFPYRNFAAAHPWNPSPSDIVNVGEQARCFEAYRNTFTQKWFLGFSVFALGEKGEDKHYYPQKPAEDIIKAWYK